MDLAVIGVNHETAPILIREKLAFTTTQKIEATDLLLETVIQEVVILSTCNRSEIYIASKKGEEALQELKKFYSDFFKMSTLEPFLFVKQGKEAIEHLYQVAAGLQSIVLGEDQILGQVKEAHAFAMQIGSSGKLLNKLFREAVTVGKEIKTETKISEYPLSVSYIGVKFLKEKLASLQGKRALLIGIGKMNQLTLKYLMEEGIDKIYIANRSYCKSEEFALNYALLEPIEYKERYKILSEVDVVITSTASPHTVLHLNEMPLLERPLYIMDIALPRDVEPLIGQLEHITLYDMDDLQDISDKNSAKRKELAQKAHEMIAENIQTFIEWMTTIKMDPTIKSLQQRCDEIYEDTIHYIDSKAHLDVRQQKIVDKMVKSSLKRLIREPINKLKETKDEEKQSTYIKIIEELFDL